MSDQPAGGVPCPHEDCERDDFATEKAMKIHHARSHGERLVETVECNHCGAEYEPGDNTTGKYCSRECHKADQRTGRVELVCEECEEPFRVPPSEADKKYCSMDCYGAARDQTEVRQCACGHSFRTYPADEDKSCSLDCRDERRTEKPRPDDVEMLVWLLYEYEGHSARATHRRANVVLDEDDRLTREEISDLLVDLGIHPNTSLAVQRRAAELEDTTDTPEGDDSWKRAYRRGEAPADD